MTSSVKAAFEEHGFILVRQLLSPPEVEKLKTYMESSKDIQNKAYGRADGQGRQSKLALWNHAGNDVAGLIAR